MEIKIDTDKIKQKFNENPTQMMFGAGAVLAGAGTLLEALNRRKSTAAFARSVDYRIRTRK